MSATISCDVAIVGGGLAGGLIALALGTRRPGCDVRLIEARPRIGSDRLWTFLASDVAPEHRWLAAPLVCHGWRRCDIAFPEAARTLDTHCYAIDARRLGKLVAARLGEGAVLAGRRAAEVTPTAVTLADGDRVEARGVIDCRGAGELAALELGWRRYLGCTLALAEPHGLERPLAVDATVGQDEGCRLVHALPLCPTTLFVEESSYADTPEAEADAPGERIRGYAEAHGWQPERALRGQAGAWPVALGGDFDGYWRGEGTRVAKAGLRAALFHPLTGNPFPDAVRTAALVAGAADLSGRALHALLLAHARNLWRRRRFYRMVATKLFKLPEPDERYRVLERFYRFDPGLIARFHAARVSGLDRLRMMSGGSPRGKK